MQPRPVRISAPGEQVSDLRERYLRAILSGDRREAVRIVVEDGLGAGVSTRDLQHGVIAAAQQEIGRLWQLNLVTVAREHVASAITQLALASLLDRSVPEPAVGKLVLVACVEGELHDLPARLLADTLELAGFGIEYLGANVPVDSLCDHVKGTNPDLVCLSVTMSFHLAALRSAIQRLRMSVTMPIMIGGHAIGWSSELVQELGVLVSGATPDTIVAQARAATGLPPE